MKKLLLITMILLSMLFVSSVGYASNGEKTIKSEVVISDVDNLNVVVLATAGSFEAAVSVFESLNDPGRGIIIIKNSNQVEDFSAERRQELLTATPYELTNVYADIPDIVGWQVKKDHYTQLHNKGLYNSRVNSGYSNLHKSDLIRSNCSYRPKGSIS